MPTINKLVIWGASGHALVVTDAVRLAGSYDIVGFIDNLNPASCGQQFCGAPILGGIEVLDTLLDQGVTNIFFGFGNNNGRLNLSEIVENKGFSIPTIIHPKATIASDVQIGHGTFVAAGAVINSGARIGNNVIVNTCSSVDHECIIEDGVHICPGAHLAGCVSIGRASWVGIGACVVDHVRIGSGSVIGAGAVVVENIPDLVLAYGVPAKAIKEFDK